VRLTEEEQRIVNEERAPHPHPWIREKMLVLWVLHCGVAEQIVGAICERLESATMVALDSIVFFPAPI